ncbi:cbb3-type cytochrome oxidase assembly protein CcoS [Aestuariicella hydrocarbonica]|uniref:Cbb3-type cytochrome oxidase assembly protein CcoS n=1 Tax=Pseudomaricurvus hydrocarbonicus TaxID=1470433 RepID=A0A9E5JSH0_9GAMM|nr:cbb3-type cytochrome oxidase assembly protein CcoS [Aestuariicella hydrocarbonica]
MESLYLLIPIAVIFLVLAVRVLYWAVNSGQYDDLDTEGHRILFDEEPLSRPTAPEHESLATDDSEGPQGAVAEQRAIAKPDTVETPVKSR